MNSLRIAYQKEDSLIFFKYNDIEYRREECKMLSNFHTIKWNVVIPDESLRETGPLHYYSYPMGWSDKTGHLNVEQPPPNLEIEFKKLNDSTRI